MGNLVTYKGENLAIYYNEMKGSIDGYTFEFEGLSGLTKLLTAPDGDKTDEGELIGNIKLMLMADDPDKQPCCFGIYLSTLQRIVGESKY